MIRRLVWTFVITSLIGVVTTGALVTDVRVYIGVAAVLAAVEITARAAKLYLAGALMGAGAYAATRRQRSRDLRRDLRYASNREDHSTGQRRRGYVGDIEPGEQDGPWTTPSIRKLP